jgi:hypothetical protein
VDRKEPWSAAFFLVVLPAALLLLANNFTDQGDNTPIMLAATSLVTEGNWQVGEFVNRPGFEVWCGTDRKLSGCVRRTAGGVYSSYPAGPVQFAAPVAAVARLVGADLFDFQTHVRLQKWTAAWVAAASLGLFFLLALHLVAPAPAWIAAALLATGSAFFTTIGQGLWQHGGIVFWSLVMLLVEFRSAGRPGRLGTALQGIACAMMLACRLSAAIVVVPLGVWVLCRSPRRAIALAATAAVAFAPWALLYFSIYGQPFGPSLGQIERGSWSWRCAGSLAGVLVSPGRGAFLYQPWMVLAFAACVPALRGRLASATRAPSPAGWKMFCVVAIVLNLFMVAAWRMWWGGWCWGPRLLADTLPLWGLLCLQPLALLWASRTGRKVILALALCGFLVNAPPVYLGGERWNGLPEDVDEHPARLWCWSDAPFLFPLLHGPFGR